MGYVIALQLLKSVFRASYSSWLGDRVLGSVLPKSFAPVSFKLFSSTIMPPPDFDPCEIYRDRLSRIAHMGHGLWHPSTDIKIGDVGYFEGGAFKSLFNVTDSRQLAEHEAREPLVYPKTFETSVKGYLKPDIYPSFSAETTSLDGGPGV